MKRKRNSNRRKVNGIFLLNKPQGLTSNQALQAVKAMFYAEKAGHTGSLDPLATGMLPICFGQATKFSQYLLGADKVYEVTAQFGTATATGDSEGEVIEEKAVPELTLEQINTVCDQFRGVISQMPPMFSALKHKGQPLYKLARQGITVEREAREVHIYELTLHDYKDSQLSFKMRSSKGTYVRSLVEDFAKALGTVGHVIKLHRSTVAGFGESQMIAYDHLESLCQAKKFTEMDSLVLNMDDALKALPSVTLAASMAFYLRQGNPIMVPNLPNASLLRILTKEGKFIGVGEVLDNGLLAPKRLVS